MNSLSAANRNYCAAAPASIAGFYMSAKRFIAHGMLYGEEGHVRQYFYYDEVTDEEISEYTYTPGEGNKANLRYHVKYRLNPEKLSAFTGKNVITDITLDVIGDTRET